MPESRTYLPIPDIQAAFEALVTPLRLEGQQDIDYLLHHAFKPRPETLAHGQRLHVQSLDLPLPPKYSAEGGHALYYSKALCKVEGEPAAEVGLRERAHQPPLSHRGSISSAFEASMLVEGAPEYDEVEEPEEERKWSPGKTHLPAI